MGAKAGFEYAAVNVRLDIARAKYGPNPALAEAANGMAAEGWTLVSCSHPQLDWTIMTFSRPRSSTRPDGEGDRRGPEAVSDIALATHVAEVNAEVERLERAALLPAEARRPPG
jgi:hypothetical protein